MTSPASPASPATVQQPPGSAWAPFRHEAFAAMWGGQFVSNIGSWMQTVAAQWLMLALTGSAAYVAFIQTAASLPVVLFAVLAGAIGDLVNRRKFLINAATFLAVLGVLFWWHDTEPTRTLPREHVGEAIRAGGRYVAASPVLRVILLRAGLFVFFAASIWALLPVAAQDRLHLGSGGYGLLLGCVGVGAVLGAVLLPRLRGRLGPGTLLTAGSIGLAGVALILGFVPVTALAAVALVVAGVAWILALSTLNSLYQLTLPQWIKARGMSFYTIVFQGGNAVGSAVLGVSAQHLGLSATLLVAAAGLALGPLAGLRYRFQVIPPDQFLPGADWPVPNLADGVPGAGPVMVTVEYWPRPGQEADLLAALRDARFSRRRTGASAWRVWQDAADPARILEQFVVASWDEHIRQQDRVTVRDQQRYDQIRAMTDPAHPVTVTHWLTPPGPRNPGNTLPT